ncbi:orotidine 5-phosphate decarboxylase, partial [Patescibacteria group bacterium]|nr:orotidine 5-phosphate decarboxylase [Patescibacteria group bacterium]
MGKIIRTDRSLVPACDVSLELYERIVRETADVAGVGAYKVGFQLGLAHGLPRIVELARQYTDKPIIYDHQKAATDIPDTGVNFAETLSASGVDAVIFFPQAGPATEEA